MSLKTELMHLNSIETGWGIWATPPFTAECDYRIGELHFENGGVLDDMQFVGSLATLSILYSPPVVGVRWGYTEDEVSTSEGNHAVFELGTPTDAQALWTQHVVPMLDADDWETEGYPGLVVEATVESFQDWLTEMRAAVDCGAHLDTLTLATSDGVDSSGWMELYIEENDGIDETYFREEAAERLIEEAEAQRTQE